MDIRTDTKYYYQSHFVIIKRKTKGFSWIVLDDKNNLVKTSKELKDTEELAYNSACSYIRS